MSTLLNLDELGRNTGHLLPAAPHVEGWSIVTLSQHLCVPAAVVLAAIDEDADIRADRMNVSFYDADCWSHGDVWIWESAADRIAAMYPAGILARLVVADPALLGQVERIGGLALHALCRHLVDYAGCQP